MAATNNKNMKTTAVKGKCNQMCPEKEIQMRQREGLLHRLEIIRETSEQKLPKADPEKVVKEYIRSAAGVELNNAEALRTPEVLIKTVHYLIYGIVARRENTLEDIYGFVFNRLRSVRQDMIIQDLCDIDCIRILEPMVYFHSYAAYIFCGVRNSYSFSEKINNDFLLECLKRIIKSYETVTRLLQDKYQGVQCKDTNLQTILPNRNKIEAIYILFYLGNFNVLSRAIALNKLWKDFYVQLSINISLAVWKKNYVRAIRLIKDLPDIFSGIASLQVPKIRKFALQINCSSYQSKVLKVPAAIIKEQLAYNSLEEVIDDCRLCGIEVDDEGIKFNKTSFLDIDKSCVQRRYFFVEDKFKKCTLNILLGAPE